MTNGNPKNIVGQNPLIFFVYSYEVSVWGPHWSPSVHNRLCALARDQEHSEKYRQMAGSEMFKDNPQSLSLCLSLSLSLSMHIYIVYIYT